MRICCYEFIYVVLIYYIYTHNIVIPPADIRLMVYIFRVNIVHLCNKAAFVELFIENSLFRMLNAAGHIVNVNGHL